MRSIFELQGYPLLYEQAALDLDCYRIFANFLLRTAKIPKNSTIVDIGCGTGISTLEIFRETKPKRVIGIDKSKEMLDLAWHKIGTTREPYLENIAANNPTPQIIKSNVRTKDLDRHIKEIRDEFRKYTHLVEFLQLDAGEYAARSISLPADAVFASQFIHWPRKISKEYETRVLQNIRDSLVDEGIFAFNTSGADFKFRNPSWNSRHLLNHPFYEAFQEAIYDVLSAEKPKRQISFDDKKIEQMLNDSGFRVESSIPMQFVYAPEKLIEVCFVGGYMQIFQKNSIDLPEREYERILSGAISYAMRKSDPRAMPVIETGIHYVAKKS